MKTDNNIVPVVASNSEIYIHLLCKHLGASREILVVAKQAAVSTRKITEFLVKKNLSAFSLNQ